MKKITDKMIIFVFCCICCSKSSPEITALLVAASFSALCQYAERPRFSAIVGSLYIILCIFFPPFLCAMPIILYDMLISELFPLIAVSAGVFLWSALSFHLLQPFHIILCVSSLLLAHRTASFDKLYKDYINTVDSSTEVNRHLKENNLRLTERKNYEVHLATLNERNRIAREIHDNVGHLLSRSILQIQALKLINDDKLRNDGLSGLGETLDSAMNSIRQSVHNLHDDSLDLDFAIKEASAPLYEKGFEVDCQCRCSENVPVRIRIPIISVVKEAVSNIIKHSSGNRAVVIFNEHPAFYQLRIEDNGRCNGTIQENGIGIFNMRARVEELGGIINIHPDSDGFRIFISIRKD